MKYKIIALAFFITLITSFANAGCFSKLTIDANTITEKTFAFDINWQTNHGSAFGSSQEGYMVPLNSTMLFQNLGVYTLHCENGANASLKPPLKITITDLITKIDQNIIIQQNCEGFGSWCSPETPECPVCNGGFVCVTPDPLTVFTFNKEGFYKVHTEFSPWTAKKEVIDEKKLWMLAREDFNVLVFSPLIAIHSTIPELLPIQPEKETSTTIIWTIQNLSTATLKIKDINYPSCSNTQYLNCSIMPNPQNLKLPPNSYLVFTQTIKLSNPPENFTITDLNIYLDVNYSNDQNGTLNIQKRSMPVTIHIKPLAQQKFSIKIKGPEDNKCYGFNGKTGITGNSAIPRIKQPFDWSWTGISIIECDKNYTSITQDYHYCDAVQFSIELLKKLKRIEEINQSLTPINTSTAEELQRLTAFHAYLMKDGYSSDLQQDLSRSIKNEFAEVPTWYNGFSQIFEDNNKFKFFLLEKNQNTEQAIRLNSQNSQQTFLSGPGLYEVRIDINYIDASTKTFILAGQPNAVISVYFTKISPPAQDSVLYYLPFDGTVGFDSTSQEYDRQGYGVNVLGKDLIINNQETKRFILPPANGTGLNSITVNDRNEFSYTNIEARGSVLKLQANSQNNYTLIRSISNATPVLLRIKQGNKNASSSIPTNEASAFYYIKKDATSSSFGEFIAETTSTSYWTGPVSSTNKQSQGFCLNLDNSSKFKDKPDSRLDTLSNVDCSLAGGITAGKAFGFSLQNLQNQSDQNFIYVQSIFYTSKNSNYQIFNACSNKDYKIITPTGNFEIAPNSSSSSLPLNYNSNLNLESLQSLLDAVKTKDLCITQDSSSIDFWWNENTLFNKFYSAISENSDFKLNKC